MEGIYRELFALRETKLVLDQEVMPAPADLQPPSKQLNTARSSRRQDVGGAPGVSKRGISTFEDTSMRNPRSSRSAGEQVLRAGNASARVDDVATMATQARSSGGRPKRPNERRVLAEILVDPDLPLPLPTFDGTFLGGVAQQQSGNKVLDRNSNQQPRLPAGSRPDDPKPANLGGGGTTAVENFHHGYFVPGVVAPRQRQSHSLPQELRAISTTPTPERRLPSSNAGAGPPGTGKRYRVRSRSSSTPTSRGTSPLPRPPASAAAAALEKHEGRVSTSRPEPGSAAALASAREQRRYTSRAVDELRQEMREREGRLEQELDRLRQSRSQRTAPAMTTPAVDSEPAAKAAPAPTVGGKRVAMSSRGRRSKGRPSSRPLASKANPAASRKLVDEDKGDQGDDGKISPSVAPTPRIKTADAQAQTATDGVQLYFQPQPTVRDALRTIEEGNHQTIPTASLPSASNAKGQQTERSEDGGGDGGSGGHYFDESSFSSSSVSDGGGDLGRSQLCPRQISPPPPVVFIEGEGRNASWRPSDDDRLIRRGGDGSGGCGGGGGAGDGYEDVLREVPGGGDGGRVLTVTGRGGDEGRGGDKGEGVAEPREIRVTAGQLEYAGSEPESESLGARVQDEVWVQLAGMLGLSTSEPTTGQSKANGTAAAEASAAAEAFHPVEQAPTVSLELMDLMREVVGQQKGIGEERSALMQVCRK